MSQQEMPKKLGRYEIVRELGKGAMGIVYEGVDPVIGRRVAIKTARRDVLESSGRAEELMERFLREAHAAGSLNHPGIITIYDADEEDGVAYIAMEYIDYGDLQDYLKKRGHIDPEEAVEIAISICNALHAAHEAGVVHRDIKPANIMVRPDGTIKLADFGIAHTDDSHLTQEGAMVGTPHYMSPEQFMGQRVDGRSDLFCVGVMLYEMLTNERPFDGEVLSTVMHKVIKVDPIEPKELNFNVPDALSRVVLKALAKNPRNRYQTGREMSAALAESLEAKPNPTILALDSEPEPGSATVVSKPPLSTTVGTTAPESATVVSAPPGATAPAGGAPRSPEAATIVSQRSPDTSAAAPATAQAAAETAPMSGSTIVGVSPKAKKNMMLPALGVVAVLAIIGFGAVKLSGNGKPEASHGTSPVSQNPAGSGKAASEEGLITSLDITVWFADTKEASFLAADQKFDRCNTFGKATITVVELDDAEKEVKRQENFQAEIVRLDKPYRHIKITASRDGYESKQIEVRGDAQSVVNGRPKPIDIVLTKVGVS